MKRIIIKTIHILSILCLCSEGFVANNLLHAERFCFEINSNNSFWDSQNKLFKSKGNSNDEVFSIAFLQDGTSLFYGNTDLFDSAREGYTPGYFVVKMNNLKIENENITFSILVKKTDLCNDTTYNAIANPYLNAEYIIPNRQTQIELEFKGQIFKDKIILDTENTSISLPNNQMMLIEISM